MKKLKVLFAVATTFALGFYLLGCNPTSGNSVSSGTDDENWPEISDSSEISFSEGTYSFTEEHVAEQTSDTEGYSGTFTMNLGGTVVLDGTEDDSNVTITYTSGSEKLIAKFDSEDAYKNEVASIASESESESGENSVSLLLEGGKYTYDNENYIITYDVTASEDYLAKMNTTTTYSNFLDKIIAEDYTTVYSDGSGNYKIVQTDTYDEDEESSVVGTSTVTYVFKRQ